MHIRNYIIFYILMVGAVLCAQASEISADNVIKNIQLSSEAKHQRYYVSLKSPRGELNNFLLLEPEHPVASTILFAGGDGMIFINEDGSIEKDTNFLVRSRHLFAEHSLRVVVVQPPSDHHHFLESRDADWHMEDISTIVKYLKSLSDVPVWLIGTSRGTLSVAAAGVMTPGGIKGIVLTAPVTEMGNYPSVYQTDVSKIKLPVLIAHHIDDNCHVTPYQGSEVLLGNLTGAPKKELLTFSGGEAGGDDCGAISSHGFLGVEEEVVTAIANWINSVR